MAKTILAVDDSASIRQMVSFTLKSAGYDVVEAVGDMAERLSIRNLMESFRGAGVVTGGPAPFDARAKQAFASALDRALTRMQRRPSKAP